MAASATTPATNHPRRTRLPHRRFIGPPRFEARAAAAAGDAIDAVVPATAASALVPPAMCPPRERFVGRPPTKSLHEEALPLPALTPSPLPKRHPLHFTAFER